MLSSGFINKVLDKVKVNKVSIDDMKKILFDVQKDRELFESVFESIIEGLIVLDENNKVQYINNIALNMFNLDLKSILDEDISEVFGNSDISEIFRNVQKSGVEIHNREIEVDNYDEHYIIRVNVFPLKQKDTITGTIIMLLDITAAKNEEERLRRAESLASLTNLAAGVAHEIKNPLSAIAIHIQIMERYISNLPENDNLKSQFESIVTIVSEEIDRLNRIISDFLFSVRPTILNKKVINIENLIQDILNLLSMQVKEKSIRLTLKVEKNFPEIICDPNYIKNAFLNIVKNSIEACDDNDEITITLHREGNNAIIKFSDTGKGISKKDINKIFEPYFTTKDFGTGLGLTIVYKIIKEHKGDISVTSKEDKWTTFTVKLPIFDEGKRLLEQYNKNKKRRK